jgi:hypothetical protein
MTATCEAGTPYHRRIQRQLLTWFIVTFALGALSIGLSVALDVVGKLPNGLRYTTAGLALVLILLWGRASLRFQRTLDEMQRRVFLEATSIVGIAAIAWAYLFPVLEKTGFVRPMTHDGYAIAALPLALIAWFIARQRYE